MYAGKKLMLIGVNLFLLAHFAWQHGCGRVQGQAARGAACHRRPRGAASQSRGRVSPRGDANGAAASPQCPSPKEAGRGHSSLIG